MRRTNRKSRKRRIKRAKRSTWRSLDIKTAPCACEFTGIASSASLLTILAKRLRILRKGMKRYD